MSEGKGLVSCAHIADKDRMNLSYTRERKPAVPGILRGDPQAGVFVGLV